MDEQDEFKKLNLSLQSPDDLRKLGSRLESAQQRQAYATSRAGLMFGCYRRAEASDPEIYAAATAAVLSEYPQDVIDFITDPRTGLPSTSQWLPSVYEVRKACEERADHLAKIELVRKKREREALAGIGGRKQ